MSDVVLSVDALTARRGARTILDSVSFAAHRGEILGVIGPNGAGKTTLFECIAGMQPYDSGSVDRRMPLFYVPDAIRPWGDQTVRWTLRICANALGVAPAEILGLDALAQQRVKTLSKGETKRLNIAIGLATPQPVLLLDEPFDGLDLRQTLTVIDTLRGVAATGRTLVLSIHQLTDAERVCDRLLLLNAGRVVAIGSVDELRERVGTPHANIEEIFLALT